MRKSFTQLFSVLMLICAFGFTSFAAAPVVATDGLSPADEATNVEPTTTEFVITFDQDVQFTAAGGTFTITKGSTLVKTITLATGSSVATIDGAELTVVHGLTLEEGADYIIGITGNAIENADNEVFTGITSGAWNFTIGDYTSPVIAENGLTPANNEEDVDVQASDFELAIAFEDAATIAPVTGKKIWVYEADGTIVDMIDAGNVAMSQDAKTATFSLSDGAYLEEYTTYYVNIEAGAFVDESEEANAFAGIMDNSTWTFTSRDYSAPSVDVKTITDVTEVGGTLNVTLSEAGTVWYEVKMNGSEVSYTEPVGGESWTSVVTGEGNAISEVITGLDDGVEYVVFIAGENGEGDVSGVASVVFTTADSTPPVVVENGNDIVVVDNMTVGVSLAFNEEIAKGAGTLSVKLQSNNSEVAAVDANDVEISYDEDNDVWVMVAPFAELESEVGYYVFVPDGFVTDVATNGYVSDFKTANDWMFTSADFVAPTATADVAESTPASENDNIILVFSEPVQLVDGTAWTDVTDWSSYLSLEKGTDALGFDASYAGTTITITPDEPLIANSSYTVRVRPNVIEDVPSSEIADATGNPFSLTEKVFTVETGDFGDATITIAPASGSDIAEGTMPSITFSKMPYYNGGDSPVAVTAANLEDAVTFTMNDVNGDAVAYTPEWDAETMTLTLNPTEALESEATYFVDFDETDFVDAYETVFTGPTASTFTMVDYMAPVATFSHTGTVTDVEASANLTITFDENVTLNGSLEDLVIFRQNGPDGAMLAWDNVDFDGTQIITISPSDDLVDGDVYYYGVAAGALKDAVDNPNADAFSTFTFAPATPDVLAVAEGGYDPAIDETGVELVEGELVASLTFTEAIKAHPTATLGVAELNLVDGSANPIATYTITPADFEGSVLTLSFSVASLISEGNYYITVPGNTVVANADNTKIFAGTSADTWSFVAADTEIPVLTVEKPANGAVDVALDAAVTVTVDEEISAGTGVITIAAGTADVKEITVSNDLIDNETHTITIPHADFTQYNTSYTVTIPAGAFVDTEENGNDELTWSFTTEANTAPVVAQDGLVPANGADLVDVNTTFSITFSEDVQVGPNGSSIFLIEDTDGETTDAIIENDGTLTTNGDTEIGIAVVELPAEVSVDGATVTFDFGVALEANKDYYILVEAGAFEDIVEPEAQILPFAGINTPDTWSFTTKDANAPEWEVSYTKRGEGMDITSDIVIEFTKPILKADESEIANANIAQLFSLTVGGTPVAFTGTINEAKTVVTLTNSSFLPALSEDDSEAEVVVAPVAEAIVGDVNLKTVEGSETFYISDYVAPDVTTLALVDGSNTDGAEFDFKVAANEAGTIYWTYVEGDQSASPLTAAEVKAAGTPIEEYTSGTETVTIDELTSETTYTVFAVAEDATGNLSDVYDTPLVVETADVTAPTIDGELPTVFAENGTLTLTFTEDVTPEGANAVIRLADTKEVVASIALVAGTENNELVIDGSTDVGLDLANRADDQQFIIEIAGGVVADVSDNKNTWDGQIGLGENAWVVSLYDRTAPTLDEFAPTAGVAQDAVFTLTFSENVKLAEGASFLIEYDNGTDWETFELLEASSIDVTDNVITLDPTRTFAATADATVEETTYRLVVSAGAILDMADLAYEGTETDGSFIGEFTIIDNVAPTATFSPADGDEVSTGFAADLTITFSEAITMEDGSAIDAFDLDSLVYLLHEGEMMAHTAVINNSNQIVISGYETPLVEGGSYTFGFKAQFVDAAENAVAADDATFTVEVPEPGEVHVVFDPDNQDEAKPTIIPVDQAFRVIFDGEVYTYSETPSENNLAIAVNDWLNASFMLEQGTTEVPFVLTIEGRTETETVIVVTPEEALESETDYVLTLVENKLQIGTGNVNVVGEMTNDYRTVDVSVPELQSANPVALALDENATTATVAKSESFTLTFNEPVKGGEGDITVYQSNGILVKTIAAADLANATNDEKTIVVGTMEDLTTNMEYYVMIPEGAITDTTGNKWAGFTAEDDWNFKLQDDVNPVVSGFSPEGANAVVDTKLSITFDRPVVLNSGTDATGFVALYKEDGTAVELLRLGDLGSVITSNGDNTVWTITISTPLEENTTYEVEVAEGTFVSEADGTKAAAGIARPMWSFTTESNVTPELLSLSPEDDSEGVLVSAVAMMKFNVDVQPGAGMIELHVNDGATIVQSFDVNSEAVAFEDSTVTVDLSEYLEANTQYYIIVPNGAITNISTSPEVYGGLLQTYDWNFTTAEDGTAPEAVLAPMETGLTAADIVLTMDFSENVVVGAGMVTIYDAVEDTVVEVFDIVDATLTDDTLVTITPSALADDMSYYVMVDAGVVTDVAGNPYAGVADNATWTFSTMDMTAPAVDMLSPDDETIADNHPMLEMVMTENVQLTAAGGSVHVIPADGDGTAALSIALTADMIVDNVISIEYVIADGEEGLAVNTAYYVTVDADAIEDMSGNAFAGISDAAEWTFTTGADYATDVEDPVSGSLEFKVYPNPFSGYVNVDNADKLSRIIISNVAGQRVKDIVNPTKTIQTGDLRSGIYFITLVTKDDVVAKTERIVKQ